MTSAEAVRLFTSTFLTLVVILDPPGALPIFLALTRRMSREQRNSAARRASLVAFGVIGSFAVFGQYILSYLHISVPALQISGGLLLLLVALELLMGEVDEAQETEGVNVAVVPLGTPLVAGPGGIVAMMLAVQGSDGPAGYTVAALALVAAVLMVYVFLRYASAIRGVLGESGTMLASRVAGLLLAAIAVQMAADGVLGFIESAH
ncbi:MAG: antibiotic resistance protein MarC [Micrococcales bacterium]|nr:MAG: antibiotic resistance protein MarC [Micrococcales bacterium]